MGAVNSTKSKDSSCRLYEDACLLDTDLKSFDSKLCDLTIQSINSLAAGDEIGSLSLDSVRVVSNNFCEVIKEVVKGILEQKKNILKNKQLFNLVEDYFQISIKTLDLCTAIEGCLNRAQISQLSIELTVDMFEEERNGCGEGSIRIALISIQRLIPWLNSRHEKDFYSRTLKRLEKFNMVDDIFTKEFFSLFDSLYAEQVSMLEKLVERENKLDNKLKSMNIWKKVSMSIFAATSALICVCNVMAAAFHSSPVLIKLVNAATVTLESMGGRWLNSMWETYENELKGQIHLINLMLRTPNITIKELDCIGRDVNNLKTKINSFLQYADFAIKEEDKRAVEIAIGCIKTKSTEFKQAIQDLHDRNEECRRHVSEAMNDVLDKIKEYPST